VIGAPRYKNRNGAIFSCRVNGNDNTCVELDAQKANSNAPGGTFTLFIYVILKFQRFIERMKRNSNCLPLLHELFQTFYTGRGFNANILAIIYCAVPAQKEFKLP